MPTTTFLAAFTGCLLAIATGTAFLVTVYLPLARRRARRQLEGALRIIAVRGAGPGAEPSVDSPANSTPGAVSAIPSGAIDGRGPPTGSAVEGRRGSIDGEGRSGWIDDQATWSDDWDDAEPETEGSGAPIERGTAWAIGIVPAGARSGIQLSNTVFLGPPEEDVRIGTPRRGEFRGCEIQVDRGCAESFAICDVLVRGVSQLWSEEVKGGRSCIRRVGDPRRGLRPGTVRQAVHGHGGA